jgi:hypothetical protein
MQGAVPPLDFFTIIFVLGMENGVKGEDYVVVNVVDKCGQL